MTRRKQTIEPGYFDALYAANTDPWGFRSSRYEADKYQATLAALTLPRYDTALEVGCSIGVFTRRLSQRCDSLLAIDASAVALAAARQTCGEDPAIQFERRMVPQSFPPGRFDLIVLSEVLYYLTAADLRTVAGQCHAACPREIVLCHWLGETDYPLTGTQAATSFIGAMAPRGYVHTLVHDEIYRLDRIVPSPNP